MSLFSMFDPVSFFGMSMNWLFLGMSFMFFPMSYWFFSSRFKSLFMLLMKSLSIDLGSGLQSSKKLFLLSLFSLFFYLLSFNFLGLFPYVFTGSAHLLITFSLSSVFWLSMMLMWFKVNLKSFLSHLCPEGTPFGLIFFMVYIELLGHVIKPITLSVRLMANMVAGHLILCLAGNIIMVLPLWCVLLCELLLVFLEIAVAVIQSYVFCVLMSIYYSDIT
uniref:ATP synthase F0 subunit 6 n=1 Tax=Spelaeomysis bottazzii TaxID=2970448 RepID=UPI002176C869|nr:ATP synthase F0 subunit 6 [Spelaeomysis bottazzii]UUL70722.1 ATP synthase F0 subunit 6 [Spelaeomysis bottazzii]